MIAKGNRLRVGYLYGGEVLYQPGESLSPRMLSDYELVYIIRGDVTYHAGNEAHPVPSGSIIFGHAGQTEQYVWDPHQTTRHAYFHFSISTLPRDWPHPSEWPNVITKPAPVAISLFKHVLEHIYEHNDWPAVAPSERESLLVEVLLDALFETHTGTVVSFEHERPEPVRRALKWIRQQIDDNPNEKISLDDIAKAAGCSSKHLCRLFSSSVGYPPAKTVMLLQLQLSLGLLTRTNLTVTEIAYRCGFDNPLYFSRCFTKTFGRPPSKVRKDHDAGIPPPPNPLPVDITPRINW